MRYSILLELLYRLHGNYENFIQIIKRDLGFIYDIRLDKTVYENLDQTFKNTLIPEYMRNLDRNIINNIGDINSKIYKKYSYFTQYFSNNVIQEIFNNEKLFEDYLHTYSFFDVFSKYINYDFLEIIYESYFIRTLQQNVRKIGITTQAIDLITKLLNISSDRIIYGNDLYRYLYLNDISVKNKILTWLKDDTLTDDELTTILTNYYNLIKKMIKKEYNVNKIYSVDGDIDNLTQQANRTILLDISTTYIFQNLKETEQQVLVDFLNNFIPYHVKIILFNLLGNYSTEKLQIQDNVTTFTINPNYLLNIVGFATIGFTYMQNNKGEI